MRPTPLQSFLPTLCPSTPLPKMHSHFMHFYPACVCWAIRWHTQPDSALGRRLAADPAAAAAWTRASARDLVLWPMLPYTAWALLYYLKARSGGGRGAGGRCPGPCLPPAAA